MTKDEALALADRLNQLLGGGFHGTEPIRDGVVCIRSLVAQIDALRSDNSIFESQKQMADELAALRERCEELAAYIDRIMIGGNHLGLVIGADHPVHETPYEEALNHYKGGDKFEAWCCWNIIMQVRDALARTGGEE